MKASKKIAVLLLIVLTLGTCFPRSAHAVEQSNITSNITGGEVLVKLAWWVLEATVVWVATEILDTAKAEAQPTEEEKKEGLPWYKYLWPGNWF